MGDLHMHTKGRPYFSSEPGSDGLGTVDDMANAAKNKGLSWIIITDHSYASYPVDLARWSTWSNSLLSLCTAAEATHSIPVMCGLELGMFSHYLIYDKTNVAATNEFMTWEWGPEPAQNVIDRAFGYEKLGFIAHPYNLDSRFNWGDWDVAGYTGLEVMNTNLGTNYPPVPADTLNKWDELLRQGRFVYGIGTSDAHQKENIGQAVTYCHIPSGTDHNTIYDALKNGHCVFSTTKLDGSSVVHAPLLAFEINGAGIGDIACVPETNRYNIPLHIEWLTDSTVGVMTSIEIWRGGKDGTILIHIKTGPASSSFDYTDTTLPSLPQTIFYYRLKGVTANGCEVYTNPIWVNVQPSPPQPDPSIYSQGDPNVPVPVTWDNPDIQLYEFVSGSWQPVNSGELDWGQTYTTKAKFYNKGCSDVTIDVKFTWARFTPLSDQGYIGTVSSIFIPSGQEVFVEIPWDTSVVSTGLGSLDVHGCVKAEIISSTPPDSNPQNNWGQENCLIQGCATAMSGIDIIIPFLIENPTEIPNGIIFDITPQKGDLWNATVTLPYPPIPPESWGTATLLLSPLRELELNEWDIFMVTARRIDTEEVTGGIDFKVIVNDPPKLDWVGDAGYIDDGVEEDVGVVNEIFTYRVKYTDANNDSPAPDYPILYIFKGDKQIQGSPFVMNEEDPTDTDYRDGKIYTYSIALSATGDDYTYRFWARDNRGIAAEGPPINVMSGPLVKLPIRLYLPLIMKNYTGGW